MKTTHTSPPSVASSASVTLDPVSQTSGGPIVIPHAAGDLFDRNGFGFHWKIDGNQAGGRFSVVHHPMAPRILAAPLHWHHREDEYSYVLIGTLGALLGDDVVTAGPGTWVFKPRNQWHTFWNAGDTPCEIIEIRLSRRRASKISFADLPPSGPTWRSSRSSPSVMNWI